MKLTDAQKKALEFVATHPGTRHKAAPCGYRFRFDAPELKRSPFRVGTLYQLIELGLVTEEGPVVLTTLGNSFVP